MKIGDVVITNIGGGGKKHRAVCVGTDNQEYIILVLATSKIGKRREYAEKRNNLNSKESLVIVQKEEYTSKKNKEACSLTEETCFDCNELEMASKEYLKKETACDPVSSEIIKRILTAIRNSPGIDQETKERFGFNQRKN